MFSSVFTQHKVVKGQIFMTALSKEKSNPDWCDNWAGTLRYYLELLDKLQKQICKTVGPLFAASLEPLAHHPNLVLLQVLL